MAKKKTISKPIDTIAYEGKVTVKFTQGNKVLKKREVKNTASKLLLQNLASYLLGRIDTQTLPHYMGVGTGSSTSWSIENLSLAQEIAGSRVPVYPQAIREAKDGTDLKGYIAPFTATFPYELIGESAITEIGLFGGESGSNLLARISLGSDPIEIAEPGMSLVIE